MSKAEGSQAVSFVNDDNPEEKFSSRTAFIFCAIGSAVGLGNVWRFPFLVYDYGGGAFFIPYIMALFFIGIPVLCTEFCIGQVWGAGPSACMTRFHRRSIGVGFAMMFAATLIVSYYSLIICWIECYLVSSFYNPQPWEIIQEDRNTCEAIHSEAECTAPCEWDGEKQDCIVTLLGKANEYFARVANVGDPYNPKTFAWWLFVAMFTLWLFVFLLLGFGAKILGFIMYATMGLPAIFIIGLLILGLVLDTENIGPLNYVGKFDVDLLSERPKVWTDAGAQICFSTSVSTGVMITFASYNQRKTNPCGQDSVIVAVSNSVFSFLAGFAVYGIAGFLSTDSGIEFSELELGGPSLLFQSYPVGVSVLGYPWAQIVNVLFFLTLFLLGLDSAVSLAEPLINTISESKVGEQLQHDIGHTNARLAVVGGLSAGFLVLDLIYCMDFGNVLLDEVDIPVNNFGLLYLTFCTCFLVGWVWEREVAFDTIGADAHIFLCVVWNGGMFVFSIIGFALPMQTINGGDPILELGSLAGALAGAIFIILGSVVSYFICKNQDVHGNTLSCNDKMYYLFWGNIERSRHIFNDVVAHNWNWWSLARLTYLWTGCVKFITPGCCLLLLSNVLTDPSLFIKFDGNNGMDIPPTYTALGMMGTWVLVIGMTVFGIMGPPVLQPMLPMFFDEFYLEVPTSRNWKSRVQKILSEEGVGVDASEFEDAFNDRPGDKVEFEDAFNDAPVDKDPE